MGRRFLRPIIHRTKNRFEGTVAVIGTETPHSVVDCVEAPGNRSTTVPAGAVLRSIVIEGRPQTLVAGQYQFLLVYRPAAENVATPIASYWDVTDPLTEEGVKLRRLSMSRCKTVRVNTGDGTPRVRFTWKGAKRMYDGDDVNLWTLTDGAGATWEFETWITFTQ